MESLVSREATFLFNNLLLVGIAFAMLWGVLFPLISEAVGDDRLNVANPYYDFFLRVLRAAAGVPDGRGAAHRLAAGVAARPGAHVHAARRCRARDRRRAGAVRRRHVIPGVAAIHLRRVRARRRSGWSSRAARAAGGR